MHAMSPLRQGLAGNLDVHCTANAYCSSSHQEDLGEV